MIDRVMELAPVAGLGYFAGVGLLKITHDVAGFPATFEWAAILAIIPAVFAVLARLQRDRGDEG